MASTTSNSSSSGWDQLLFPSRFLQLAQQLYTDATSAAEDKAQQVETAFSAAKAKASATVGLDDFTANVLPALKVLAESLQIMGQNPAFQNWTSADWLLGLTVLAQHNTSLKHKSRGPRRVAASSQSPLVPSAKAAERRALVEELLRYVRICDAVYASTTQQFCDEARLPLESVVRSFDGSILSPKFMILCDDNAQEIVLVVRGTASILDFVTDICLVNEPFATGQGHRGMVLAANWLVKNVRLDLVRLTHKHPNYKLVTTGHSLGAGVSALVAMQLKREFPKIQCIAFATPASVTQDLASACHAYVTTVVNGDDCVPRIHQHSMLKLQHELAQFDWRTTLKQMVDEEVEERKTLIQKKHDEQMQMAYDAFQRLKVSQQLQAEATLASVLKTPLVKRVSASLELTKAAFWTDTPANERLASVKQVVQRQLQTGDDAQVWESVETAVAGLESLARALNKPAELQALLAKSKALLASTSATKTAEMKAEQEDLDALDDLDHTDVAASIPEWSAVRDRLKSVIDQSTQSLRQGVEETMDEMAESVVTSVQSLKEDVNGVVDAQTCKLEESVAEIQEDWQRSADALVQQAEETAWKVAAVVVDAAKDMNEQTSQRAEPVAEPEAAAAAMAAALVAEQIEVSAPPSPPPSPPPPPPVAPELLHDPLFPPGRILYLNRLMDNEEQLEDLVELLDATNDGFSRVVLSNQMVLDHLCTTYERVLQATHKSLDHFDDN